MRTRARIAIATGLVAAVAGSAWLIAEAASEHGNPDLKRQSANFQLTETSLSVPLSDPSSITGPVILPPSSSAAHVTTRGTAPTFNKPAPQPTVTSRSKPVIPTSRPSGYGSPTFHPPAPQPTMTKVTQPFTRPSGYGSPTFNRPAPQPTMSKVPEHPCSKFDESPQPAGDFVVETCQANLAAGAVWTPIGSYDGYTDCYALEGDTTIFDCIEGWETS